MSHNVRDLALARQRAKREVEQAAERASREAVGQEGHSGLDYSKLYDIIYALAARDGRVERLFGNSAELSREAFARSCAGDAFPELWFEVPLRGKPWFDLHVLTAREGLDASIGFTADTTGGNPQVFTWFAQQEDGVRQLALSWDTGSGDAENPAVQLLVGDHDPKVTCDFLEAAGRADAVGAYRAFRDHMPQGWFACYTGTFPTRPGRHLRVECIPGWQLQRAYARDIALLEEHLRQAGVTEFGDTLLERCQLMTATPFQIEFQFDVELDGAAGPTLGVSLRFAGPPGGGGWESYDSSGSAGELMRQVEEWGLADDRWHDLVGTMFAKRVSFGGESVVAYCYPAFLKLRWRNGDPLDAKAYLIAGLQGQFPSAQ